LQPEALRLAGGEMDHAPLRLLPLVPTNPAGRRLETDHIGPFAGHGPLHKLGQLLWTEAHREGYPSLERRIFEACFGPPLRVRPRTVVEDALAKPRRRGRERIPILKPLVSLDVPRLRRLPRVSGPHEACRLVQEGPAEVDVVEEHQGLRAVTLVANGVLDPHAGLADAGGDRARKDQVCSEHLAFAHFCARLEEAVIPFPPDLAREERGGCVGDPAVQPELLPTPLRRLADVLEPAGDEQPSSERPEPTLPLKLPEVRRHRAGR
jgi:hypothetical protein